MKLIQSKPITSGTRHYKYTYKNFLSRSNKLLKLLIFKIHSSFGKSFTSGHTTVWGKNSGCKKLYRKLNFLNNDTLGIILFSTYDPNRTAFIFAVFDFLKLKFFYTLGTHLLSTGFIIGCKIPNYKYFLGFRYKLYHQLQGSVISMISLKKKKKLNMFYPRVLFVYYYINQSLCVNFVYLQIKLLLFQVIVFQL